MDIDSSSPPSHGIVCGIFGVYCSQCNRTVKKTGNSLYPPDQKRLGGILQIMDATSVTPPTHVL
eukprot:scaffold10799_cov172-Alexandrium_tamarense.AAC.1